MADEKKETPPRKDPFVEIVGFFFAVIVIAYLINGFIVMLTSNRLFSLGLKGFNPQGIWLSHTKPISLIKNPIGSTIMSTKETTVYNSVGGKQIGIQKFGARGKILDGPVVVGGERYWYVDYGSGVDGWVKEGDIANLQDEPGFFERSLINILNLTWLWKSLSVLLSILFITRAVYLSTEIKKLRMNERALLYPEVVKNNGADVNPKWTRILNHIESLNENDWRLAIIECDIMLDDLLDKLSLSGETIGDKLKAVEKSDFTTIDNAWEAHKIRNQIAHEGSGFVLNQREARRVVELYRTVFDEFKII